MASGSFLLPSACSCSSNACCSLSFNHRFASCSIGFPRESKALAIKCRTRGKSRARGWISASHHLHQLSEENVALGTIQIQPESQLSVIECNGIVRSSLPDSMSTMLVEDPTTNRFQNKFYGDGELLSRCTSVAERSAIALATMAYERAKRLFNLVSNNLTDLEHNFTKRSKGFGFLSTVSGSVSNEDEFKILHERVSRLEQELSDKDQKLQAVVMEAKNAYDQLSAAQHSPPRVIHDVDIIVDEPEDENKTRRTKSLSQSEARCQQELLLVEERVAKLLKKLAALKNLVSAWKTAFSVLELQSQNLFEALQFSVQELTRAYSDIQSLNLVVENQTSDITAKEEQLLALEGELSITRTDLESISKSFSVAEQQKAGLEEHVRRLEEALKHEKETIAAVVRSSSSQKDSLAAAEKKVASLTTEASSLKSLVEGKEELISAMREESKRNANMLVSAAKTREALLIAEKRIEQLNNQVSALEEEVKSRDLVLNDIKEEAVQSTEALRLAAQIKQDLNVSRQRELEVSQELERMKDVMKDLRQEVVENNRAVRAEQALRQLESEMDEVTSEVEILRKGVEARDEAIQLMKEEVDRNIDVLSHAAGNRELVRELEEHIEELKAEMRKKDTMLAAMGKGLDVSSGAYKSSSNTSSTLFDDPSSDYNLPPSSSSSSSGLQPFTNDESKTRKRNNRNSGGGAGGGYKRNPRQGL